MRRRTKVLVGVGAALVVAVVALALALPWWVRKRLVEEAAARHVALAIDGVRVRPGAVTLTGVVATSSDVPNASVTADTVAVELDGARPTDVRLEGVKASLQGDLAVVLPALDRLAGAQPKGAGEGGAPPRLHFANASLEWARFSGETSALHLTNVTGEVGGAPLGAEAKLDAVMTVTFGSVQTGPWNVAHARDAKAITTTWVFIPAKGEGAASLRASHAPDGTTSSIDAKVANLTPLTELGFPAPLLSTLGLEGASVKLDTHHEEAGKTGKGVVRELSVAGLRLKAAPAPLAASMTATYEGPIERMPLSSGTARLGPFTGPLTGSFGRPSGGFACDLSVTSTVMPCADALREQAKTMTGGADVVGGLGALARAFGVPDVVSGEVQLKAAFVFDSRNLSATRLTLTPSAQCDLSFLPR